MEGTKDSASHRDRVAVVTGAAQGMGQSICRGLAENGAAVVGVDLGDTSATQALVESAGGRWLGLRTDVSDPADVEELAGTVAGELGGCDILVNNAATYDAVSWDELDLELWRRVLSVDLEGPFLTCKAFVPMMQSKGWGRIVNFSSGSVLRPMPQFVAYRAAKLGLVGFTRALAFELGKEGITANVVSPGMTRTIGATQELGEDVLAAEAARRAIPRVGEPEDIVGTILYLTSDAATMVTGQTLMVNGGAAFV
jgi:NAD(P)-dependent dehydrogenase (short-subunit alcohol dehydrogenase family)